MRERKGFPRRLVIGHHNKRAILRNIFHTPHLILHATGDFQPPQIKAIPQTHEGITTFDWQQP